MDAERTDHQLIADYLERDDDASLRTLFERHARQLHGFLARFTGSVNDADDLAQETLLKAWRHLKSVDPGRSFKTWLFSIARRTAIDHLRKRRTVPFSTFDDDDGGNAISDRLEDDADLPDEVLAREDAVEALREALAGLSPPFREVMVLRHDSELTFEEIAETLDEPLNTVKSRYRRAFLALRKRMTGV